jgi:hypothetical protein
MAEAPKKAKRKTGREADAPVPAAKARKPGRRRSDVDDRVSRSKVKSDRAAQQGSPGRESHKDQVPLGDEEMANGTTEQRLERLEQVLQQIAQLTAQFGPGRAGGAGPQAVVRERAGGPRVVSGQVETYIAQGGGPLRFLEAAAGAAAATSAFTIEVRFLGGLTDTQKNAFKGAADRWSQVIVGAVPSVQVDGEIIRGVLILAQGSDIDGPGKILGQAGPTRLRPASAGQAAFIPAKGEMMFDTADLDDMERRGTLNDVITHEMGHVLGIGTIWTQKGFLNGAGTTNPTFIGPSAMREYGTLRGSAPTAVPVENTGGPGTRDSHWRESVFANELMTGFVGASGNPLSRLTVGSLDDLGYGVDMSAAEPYSLPDLLRLAEGAALEAAVNELELGTMLPHLPIVLPEGSIR